MIYYDEPWLTIHWDESVPAVWMQWKRYAEGADFRSGLDAGITFIQKKHGNRWLADLRQLGPVRQEDQQWTNQDWFPRAIVGGVRFMALVSPRAAVARLSVKQIMNRVNDVNLLTAHFDDLEAARTWLRSPPKVG